MFIQTEETPNPNTLKFMPGRQVFIEDYRGYPASYSLNDNVSCCPIAKVLLEIDHVSSVFLGEDFISVTKEDDSDWYVLKPHILGTIMEFSLNDVPFILTNSNEQKKEECTKDIDDVSKKIIEILETRVRPAVAQDGGDIVFDSFQNGVVYLQMKGACAGCPSSAETLKSGIENMLKFYVPEVEEVQQVVV